jgi:hypothetical protein
VLNEKEKLAILFALVIFLGLSINYGFVKTLLVYFIGILICIYTEKENNESEQQLILSVELMEKANNLIYDLTQESYLKDTRIKELQCYVNLLEKENERLKSDSNRVI